jgi:hypothetical protein
MIVCAPLFAHHGGSDYDTKNLMTLRGTVTEFNWSNPHCQILMDVKQGDGKVVNWSFETLAPEKWIDKSLVPTKHTSPAIR